MKKFLYAFSLFTLVIASGCSSTKIDPNNPDDLYKDAMEDVADKRYIVALEKLKTIKNKFPYSKVATQAKLSIADVNFAEESYIEAAAAYESFRDLHPKYEKADYVLYQIAESYYLQLPGTEDRDHTPAKKAIENYKELLTIYPKSSYADKAREHLIDCTNRLASKEMYVANYYFKRELYESSAQRYEKVVDQFSGSSSEEDAYLNLGRSLLKLKKDDEANHIFQIYLSKFPSGKYVKRIEDHLKNEHKTAALDQ